jgi:sugar lactone lactonase YvrE
VVNGLKIDTAAGDNEEGRMSYRTSTLLDGLAFPEGPRWHEGKLWFSDVHNHRVMTVDMVGKATVVVEVPGRPSGLGWSPNGRLLIVSMTDRRLLAYDRDGLSEVADLSGLASFHCNDMVVDAHGRAYVGNCGFDLYVPEPAFHKQAEIVLVEHDGHARVVADGLSFPNGTVIVPDGNTLIIAETFANCLTAFEIKGDGSLTNRRVWAQLEDNVHPDGICLDVEGAIWVASPSSSQVLRVHEGGRVSHRINVETTAFACMLGGTDRRTLFILTAATHQPDEARTKASGRIEFVRVEVPGAGLP